MAGAVVVAVAERMLEYTLDVVKLEPGDKKRGSAEVASAAIKKRKKNRWKEKCFSTMREE